MLRLRGWFYDLLFGGPVADQLIRTYKTSQAPVAHREIVVGAHGEGLQVHEGADGVGGKFASQVPLIHVQNRQVTCTGPEKRGVRTEVQSVVGGRGCVLAGELG